jgi:hypothetical protein
VDRPNALYILDLGQSITCEGFSEREGRVPPADHGQVGIQFLDEQVIAIEQGIAKSVLNEYQDNGEGDAEAEKHKPTAIVRQVQPG